ncbi:MAG: glycosyltransferase family 2 protein [Pseudomonadota bacterium]
MVMVNGKSAPKVSVCMPVYNGQNFLSETLDAILGQDFEDFELVVTDNASTDGTAEILGTRASQDARIRYIRNPENIGAAANYNLGFERARGHYIKWAAHDDLLSSNFLSRTVDILDRDPETGIAFGATAFIDEDGQPSEGDGIMPENLSEDPAVRFRRALYQGGHSFPIFGLFRAEDLARTTLHRKYYGSDRALFCEMNLLGKLRIDPDATFKYRWHAAQSVKIADSQQKSIWQGGSAGQKTELRSLSRVRHLLEVAGRHPDLASPTVLRWEVAKFAARPSQIGRYGLETIQAIAPNAGNAVRPMAIDFYSRVKARSR